MASRRTVLLLHQVAHTVRPPHWRLWMQASRQHHYSGGSTGHLAALSTRTWLQQPQQQYSPASSRRRCGGSSTNTLVHSYIHGSRLLHSCSHVAALPVQGVLVSPGTSHPGSEQLEEEEQEEAEEEEEQDDDDDNATKKKKGNGGTENVLDAIVDPVGAVQLVFDLGSWFAVSALDTATMGVKTAASLGKSVVHGAGAAATTATSLAATGAKAVLPQVGEVPVPGVLRTGVDTSASAVSATKGVIETGVGAFTGVGQSAGSAIGSGLRNLIVTPSHAVAAADAQQQASRTVADALSSFVSTTVTESVDLIGKHVHHC